VEYPIALVLAAMLRPADLAPEPDRAARKLDFGLPMALGAALVAAIWAFHAAGLAQTPFFLFFGFGHGWNLLCTVSVIPEGSFALPVRI
jgi:hypothetical protein